MRRPNLWTSLNDRCAGLAGDLTAQLGADWWLNTAQANGTVSR